MRIELVKIANFRQFYGEQNMRFSGDLKKNVTIINGLNGAGKTSILMALNWCLYGLGHEEKAVELINKRALSETKQGKAVQAKVNITFIHEGNRFTAERVLEAERVSNEEWRRDAESRLSLSRIRPDGQFEKLPNPKNMIESIMPSAVSSYFFFDGEKIDQFARPGHEEEVRSAIRNVLKIEALERARTHLANVASEYRSELRAKVSGKLQDLLTSQQELTAEQEKNRTRLGELQAEHAAANKQYRDINERLGQLESSRELQVKRLGIETRQKVMQQKKDDIWETIRDVSNQCFTHIASPSLIEAQKILDEKREKGEMPPGIREQLIEDLLKKGECICKRPLEKGEKPYECLKRLLSNSVSSKLEQDVNQTSADIRSILSGYNDGLDKVKTLMQEKSNIDKELDALYLEHDEITQEISKISACDQEEIASLEKKRQEYQQNLQENSHAQGRIEERIESLKSQLERLGKEVSKAEISEKKAKGLQTRLDMTVKAANAVEKMCGVFASDMRKNIQKEAKLIFRQFVWKESQFQDICLSDDYHLEVIDKWGSPAKGELSAGERQVLSLAFITGMSKVTGEEAPLVMDTPFGRLSGKHRENIAKQLPKIASQVVLLVTDEELQPKSLARKNLEPVIGLEYNLEFEQSTGCTTITQLKNN